MNLITALLSNRVLMAVLAAWFLAQFIKVPIEYLRYKHWDFRLWFASGGMPSSHSALMIAATLTIGIYNSFSSPLFALAVATSMVVLYDAAGVRRQAGFHAERINIIISELRKGHPLPQAPLQEMLGHTPAQVFMGSLLGVLVAVAFYFLWPPVG